MTWSFCYPYEESKKLLKSFDVQIKSIRDFDVSKNFISPNITRNNVRLSLFARVQILKRVYRGEYHTDSFDFKRLSKRIQCGDESIWFWGSKNEVDRLLKSFKSLDEDVPQDLNLGTVSLICAEREFGQGVGELCRSGSMDDEIGAKCSSLYRTLAYMSGKDKLNYDKYHTLNLVPRARASTKKIRGGEAVQRLHSKYIKSRFLGFAPWYVMQGNNIEQLEYRELHRNPEDVKLALEKAGKLYFYKEIESDYAKSIFELSYNQTPKIKICKNAEKFENYCASYNCKYLKLDSVELQKFNHTTLIFENSSAQSDFDNFNRIKNWLTLSSSCHVVRLDLSDSRSISMQKWLSENGFKLTNLSGPKKTWTVRNNVKKTLNIPTFGFWSRPSNKWKLVQPFYYYKKELGHLNNNELFILDYLKNELNFNKDDC